MEEAKTLIEDVEKYQEDSEVEFINRAIRFAKEKHRNYSRFDKTPYILHTIDVGRILANWKAPKEIVTVGILHDVLKSQYACKTNIAEIRDEFGEQIMNLLIEVDQIDTLGTPSSHDESSTYSGRKQRRGYFAKAMLQTSPMAAIIKIADRLQNLKTVHSLPKSRKLVFATNILNVFSSVAYRLGMANVMRVLQDESFQIISPEEYHDCESLYKKAVNSKQILGLIDELKEELKKDNITAEVFPYFTHKYGIHRKYLEKDSLTPIEILSVNVITETEDLCYNAIKTIHKNFLPLNEMKDLIAQPKLNGYRALHTRVLKSGLGVFQVAIMTRDMALVAEHGITALWQGIENKDLLPEIKTIEPPAKNSILVLTPQGDAKYLEVGSTPIDFAYSVHTILGHQCRQVLINGKQKPLDTRLKNGDVVDIIAGRGIPGPNPEWEQIVATDLARQAIRNWIKRKKRAALEIEAYDRVGLLKDITELISNKGHNIRYFSSKTLDDGRNLINLQLNDIEQSDLDEIKSGLEKIHSVIIAKITSPEASTSHNDDKRITKNISYRDIPFNTQRPARATFKGRAVEINRIFSKLNAGHQGNTLFVWGQRRVGKTSLLKYLEEQELSGQRYLPIYTSLQKFAGEMVGFFLHSISRSVAAKINHKNVNAPNAGKMKKEPIYYFQRFIEEVEKVRGDRNILFIIDEFQGITSLKEEGTTLENAFGVLRELIQHNSSVSFILCGGGVLERLKAKAGFRSLLNVVDFINIDCLEREDAKELITEPLPNQSLWGIDEDAINELLKITNCHPCYIQNLCKLLCEKGFVGKDIKLSDVNLIVQERIKSPTLESILDHFWIMDLGEEESQSKLDNLLILATITFMTATEPGVSFNSIKKKISKQITEERLEIRLRDLGGYGTVIRKGDQYCIKIPLLKLWLEENYPVERVIRMINSKLYKL